MRHLTYSSVADPAWANSSHTVINVNVKFDHLPVTVPFTATDDPACLHASEIFQHAVAGAFGAVAPYVEPEPTIDDYRSAIAAHIEAIARSRQYDSAVSLASYSGSTNPAWAAEAASFSAWRDAVWGYVYTELDAAQNGNRAAPRVSEFIAELPVIEWA